MDEIISAIEIEKDRQLNLKALFEEQLELLPEGTLSISTKRNIAYYAKCVKGQRVYLGKENHPEVEALQRRFFLEESIRRINMNVPLFNKIRCKYEPINPTDILLAAPKSYTAMTKLDLVYRKNPFDEAWEREPYSRSRKHPEGLIHLTIEGEYVRSKSEVLIANNFVTNGIPYRYEEELRINGITISPDFTILGPRRKIIIWEHFGMINNPDYLKKCIWKIGLYLENGYRLWDNLIITFDDADGAINTQIIEEIINTFIKNK